MWELSDARNSRYIAIQDEGREIQASLSGSIESRKRESAFAPLWKLFSFTHTTDTMAATTCSMLSVRPSTVARPAARRPLTVCSAAPRPVGTHSLVLSVDLDVC